MAARLYFNPACSKCRTAAAILDDEGIDAEEIHYLERPPSVDELRSLMDMLGIDDPQEMARKGEPVYAELELAGAPPERVLDAIAAHPILLERPILVRDGRAVIGRPPERVLELLGD